jgi:hypothetical protein
MKKITTIICAAICLSFIFTGCTSFRTNRTGGQLEVEMELKVKPNVTIGKEKVSGTATCKALFGVMTWGVSKTVEGMTYNGESVNSGLDFAANKAKAGATFMACKKAKADFLISPQYNIVTKDYLIYKVVKCTVTGFPGKLNGVEEEKK